MKRILQLLFVSAIAFSCAEQELETSAPNVTPADATVTLILDDIPEGYEGDDVYVFTRNNEGEVYALTSGTATDGETISVVPTQGGAPFTLIAYITTDEDWVEKLAEMTTMPTSPKFSDGFYSVSANLSDKEGTYVTSSWGIEVDGPANADAGSLAAVLEVEITTPANDAQIGKGSIVAIIADVDDNINSGITSVQFLLDGSEIETIEEAPYSINWNTIDVEVGEHVLSVVATNVAGNTATDEVEVLITTTVNTAPTVTINSPLNDATVQRQTIVSISGSVSDDGDIERAELRINGSLVATFDESTGNFINGGDDFFNYNWDTFDNQVGQLTIEVEAFDLSGASRSAFANVTLTEPANYFPRVEITAPADGSSFTAGAMVTFNVNVNDPDGDPICEVRYYRNGFQIGTSNTSPYSFTYDTSGLGAGDYEIEAQVFAEDEFGNCFGANSTNSPQSEDTIIITIQ